MAVINVGGLSMTALPLTALLWHAGLPTGATLAQPRPDRSPCGSSPPPCLRLFNPRSPTRCSRPFQEVVARLRAAENDRLTRRAFEVGAGTSQDRVVSEFQLFQARLEAFLAEAACDG